MSTNRAVLSRLLVEKGAKAYHYVVGTTTQRVVFKDPLASVPHTFPILADATGRMPAVYVPYGSYRERVISRSGIVIWDDDEIPNPAPVTTTGSATAPESLFLTGDIKFRIQQGSLSGYIRLNGRSIGNLASGATERANADCEALFVYLWQLGQADAPVSGGRGASAAADWAANKTLTPPDGRKAVLMGLYGMGGSALQPDAGSSVLAADADRPGARVGAEAHTLTTPQMPAHGHAATSTVVDNGHLHGSPLGGFLGGFPGGPANYGAGSGAIASSGTTSASQTGISVNTTIASAGGGQAHNNVPPSLLGTYYMKL